MKPPEKPKPAPKATAAAAAANGRVTISREQARTLLGYIRENGVSTTDLFALTDADRDVIAVFHTLKEAAG